MLTALQLVDDFPTLTAAERTLDALGAQVDFLGGRLLAPHPAKSPRWRVQAFFADTPGEWFPDGVRRVSIPDGQRRALGIRDEVTP